MRAAQDVDVLTDRRPSGAWSALRWSLPTAITIIVVDQLTKEWALNTLAPGPCSEPDACIDLVAGVRFNLVFNTGAAFTRGSGYGPIIGVLAIIMTGVLVYLSTRRQDRFGIILFGALAGGAVGNLLDRIFRADDGPLSGAVIDFIDVGWWPVFNVADMAIVIGVVSIIAHAFLIGEPIVDPPGGGSDPDGEPAGEVLDRPDVAEADGQPTGDDAMDATSDD
ncbi:MAG: signal peptidase II, partial [Actinomycetota bacterium]